MADERPVQSRLRAALSDDANTEPTPAPVKVTAAPAAPKPAAPLPTEETAPAVYSPPGPPVAASSPEEAGLVGQFEERDWVIPSLYICQPSSTEFPDVKPGALAMRDGRCWSELRFVPLRIAATRAYWGNDVAAKQPLCASNDRIYGRPFGEFEPYDDGGGEPNWPLCARCPHFRDEPWEQVEGCFRGYAALLALPDEDDEVVILRIKGTSASPWAHKVLAYFRPRPGKRVPGVWTKTFVLGTTKGDDSKGNYFVLAPMLDGPTDEPERYAELAATLVTVTVGATEEGLPAEEEGMPFGEEE